MTKHFNATSTADEVLDGVDLSGKRILITGISAGPGVETTRVLAAHGAEVVGTARDVDKAKKAGGHYCKNCHVAQIVRSRRSRSREITMGKKRDPDFRALVTPDGLRYRPFPHSPAGTPVALQKALAEPPLAAQPSSSGGQRRLASP